jgi:glutamine synthetase
MGVDGMDYIHSIIKKLGEKHQDHLELYGDNSQRLTGHHETSSKDLFTYGAGDRTASIRIPTITAQKKLGYIEDRRPASDMDPYLVCAMIADTTLLEKSKVFPLISHFRKW